MPPAKVRPPKYCHAKCRTSGYGSSQPAGKVQMLAFKDWGMSKMNVNTPGSMKPARTLVFRHCTKPPLRSNQHESSPSPIDLKISDARLELVAKVRSFGLFEGKYKSAEEDVLWRLEQHSIHVFGSILSRGSRLDYRSRRTCYFLALRRNLKALHPNFIWNTKKKVKLYILNLKNDAADASSMRWRLAWWAGLKKHESPKRKQYYTARWKARWGEGKRKGERVVVNRKFGGPIKPNMLCKGQKAMWKYMEREEAFEEVSNPTAEVIV
ncbi:hypothetical protein C8F04DRAFT_1196013 [Mycena alexandri]|uniref:Uncharacterized protein n=1 Tax=Mycena alexandri TaxID=1745969 RepID=A0AAD6WQ11_9AGAR|nr:hypothetical protein C8F04DRAFT_1196013 [Mycena alexandri]